MNAGGGKRDDGVPGELSSDESPMDVSPTEGATSFQVLEPSIGGRLDVFLTDQLSGVSRARIRRGIDAGLATIDGTVRKASYRLAAGQTVRFTLPPPPAPGPQPEAIPLDLLYEDDAIAVVNKPPGMVVHPARGHWSGTLASALVHHFGQLSNVGGPTRPGIVHRLDRDTSGVIVVAKTDTAHENLAKQFQDRKVQKQYVVLVAGNPDRDRDQIDQPIGDHPSQREKKALRAGHASSRESQTFVEVVERFPGIALMRAFPKTGRTHQIRLHLCHIRCPVLCDKLYGGRSQLTVGQLRTLCRNKQFAVEFPEEHILLDRQALHAERLTLAHPISGKEVTFTAPMPDDMEQLIRLLKN